MYKIFSLFLDDIALGGGCERERYQRLSGTSLAHSATWLKKVFQSHSPKETDAITVMLSAFDSHRWNECVCICS